MKLTLTVEQIKNLAEFAGLHVTDEITEEDKECTVTVTACPSQGVKYDDGSIIHCRHIAYFEEYQEEGVFPLDRLTKTRADIVREAGRAREEIAQLFRDAEYWNNNVRKPDQTPIVPDPDGKMGALAQSLDKMLAHEAKLGLAKAQDICPKCAHKMTHESDFNPETGEKAQADWWECGNCGHREVA